MTPRTSASPLRSIPLLLSSLLLLLMLAAPTLTGATPISGKAAAQYTLSSGPALHRAAQSDHPVAQGKNGKPDQPKQPHIIMPPAATGVYRCVGGAANPGGPCKDNFVFSTVAAAVGASADGDTVLIANGGYDGVAVSHSIYIFGGYPGGPGGFGFPNTVEGTGLGGPPAISVQGGAAVEVGNINLDAGIEVISGNLSIAGDGVTNAAISVATGSAVGFISGQRALRSGFNSTGGGFTRVAGAAVTVSQTISTGNFGIESGNLTVSSPLSVTNFSQLGGAISGIAPITLAGTYGWSGGDINSGGTLTILHGATMNITTASLKVLRARTIDNFGTIALAQGGDFGASGGAVVNNKANGLFDTADTVSQAGIGSFVNESGGRDFNNAGILRKSSGSGAALMDMYLVNSGTIQVQSGELQLRSDGSSSGPVQLSGGARLTVLAAPYTFQAGSNVTGAGFLHLPNTTLHVTGANGISNILLDGGRIDGSGAISVTGVVSWTNGVLAGASPLNLLSGAKLNIYGPGAKYQENRTINNHGTIYQDNSGTFGAYADAVINNMADGLYDVRASDDEGIGVFSNAGGGRNFNNYGTFRKSGGPGTTEMGMYFVNPGIVDIISGTLKLTADGVTTGTINLAANTLLTTQSSYTLDTPASVTGAGAVQAINPTFHVPGRVSVSNFNLPAGTLDTTGVLTIGNTLNWTGGSLGGAGHIVILAGATMDLAGPGGHIHRNTTIDNFGTIYLDNGGSFGASGGALINNMAGALFDIRATGDSVVGGFSFEGGGRDIHNYGTFRQSGAGGTTTEDMYFINDGTVEALAGTLNFSAGFQQNGGLTKLNGGSINANGGLPINGGTLSGSGTIKTSVTSAGLLSPGFSPGGITIQGDYTQSPSGTLKIEIGSTQPITGYDQLNVTGNAFLNGTLNLSAINGFVPAAGQTFQALICGSCNGNFAAVSGTNLGSGRTFTVSYNPTAVTIGVNAPPTNTPTVTPTSAGTATPTPTFGALTCQNVVWANPVNVTIAGNNLTKKNTSGWNGGAISSQGILSGNGYVQTTVADLTSYAMFGLSKGDSNQDYHDIDFALYTYPASNALIIYELGTQKASVTGYAVGDVLRVSNVGTTIRYYRNNAIIYTSALHPAFPLQLDSSIYNVGAKLSNAQICGSNIGVVSAPPATATPTATPVEENVAWMNPVNVTVSGNSLTKKTTTGWNGGAASDRAVLFGDAYASAVVNDMSSYYMFGLSHGDTDQGYRDIDYALYVYPPTNELLIYEVGHMRTRVTGYALGDVLRVALESGVIKYYRNGAVIYTSALHPAYPLLVDDSLSNVGSHLFNVKIGGTSLGSSEPPITSPATAKPASCTASFSDVPSSAYYSAAVHELACAGAVSGYADGTFRPFANTTRGQLLKMLALANGWELQDSPIPTFSDVDFANPFYRYIETAAAWHVISGYADGTFRPNAPVTRGQLAKIVVAAMAWPTDTSGGAHFSDVATASVFYQYVETAYHNGLINGYADGTFNPGAAATRGQIAKIVYKAVMQP